MLNPDMNVARLLGAAQLVVFFASLFSDQQIKSIVGTGSISDSLVNISANINRMRVSSLVALINSLAIIALGVLFYIALNQYSQSMALVALGCFLAEAITLAVSKIGAYGLIPLSQQFVAAGSPEPSYYQTLGEFLYKGVDRRGYDIHMLFFCVGGMLWYYLLYISGNVPRLLSGWGLVAICLLAVPVVLTLLDRESPPAMVLGLLYVPFEPVLGLWLLIRGFN